MEKTYSLNSTFEDFDSYLSVSAQNLFLPVAKSIPMSQCLTDKVWQHHLCRQLHHQPADKSILIPEKLMSGEAAFLNQSTFKTCKPIIFDCTSLADEMVTSKIKKQIEYGLKTEFIAAFASKYASSFNLMGMVFTIFFYWLAEHHKADSDGPVWLFNYYKSFGISKYPNRFRIAYSTKFSEYPFLKLPPETIKSYFNQPSAVVIQEKELLVLLDEFLSLVAN